jgi:hypothetical protein
MDLEYLIDNKESEELIDIIRKYFSNDYEFFFQYIIDEGLIPDDKISDSLYDIFPNEYLLYLIRNKKGDIVKDYYATHVSDIKKIGDKFYLEVPSPENLSKLFPKDYQDFVERVIDGDVGYYDNFENYEVSGLIKALTPENRDRFIEIIKEMFLNKLVAYTGDNQTILDYIKSDDADDYFTLTSNRLNTIINDDFADFIENSEDLESLKNDLNGYFNMAENQSINDEYYDTIMNAIKYTFGIPNNEPLGQYETVTKKTQSGGSYKYDVLLIDITKLLLSYIQDSVENSSRTYYYSSNSETIMGYYGSLLDYILEHETAARVNFDYLYPSSNDVIKNYNSYFYDNT